MPYGPISRSPGPRKALCSEMRDPPLRVHSLPVCPGRYSASLHSNTLTVILFLLSSILKKLSRPSVHPTEHTDSLSLGALYSTQIMHSRLWTHFEPFSSGFLVVADYFIFRDTICLCQGQKLTGTWGEKCSPK